jgi:hypothetical protein
MKRAAATRAVIVGVWLFVVAGNAVLVAAIGNRFAWWAHVGVTTVSAFHVGRLLASPLVPVARLAEDDPAAM